MSEMNVVISQLSLGEWQKYRDIRLLALRSDPYAFGASYEEEINLSEVDWCNRINAMWFAVIDQEPVGLIGLLRKEHRASKHCGYIFGLWVKPAFRDRGIAKNLIKKLQDLAPSLGLRKISLLVSRTQPAARNLYEKMGFEEIGLLKENLLKNGQYFDQYLMEWQVRAQGKNLPEPALRNNL